MVAGGGASVIYADTVWDLGFASELGNYAEYSGAPNEDAVLQYDRVVIDFAIANPDGRKRAFVIEGGIANFTYVAATFNGIIRAPKEKEVDPSLENDELPGGGDNFILELANVIPGIDEAMSFAKMLNSSLRRKIQGTCRRQQEIFSSFNNAA